MTESSIEADDGEEINTSDIIRHGIERRRKADCKKREWLCEKAKESGENDDRN